MGRRFNPAPGWPQPPPGFVPPPHWQPDPSWPPAPAGWQLWVDDNAPDPATISARPGEFGSSAADAPPWTGDFGTGTGDTPSWAHLSEPPSGPLTGPPTQAYVPGATGPQDPFGPGDPFTRPGPPGPPGPPGAQGGPGRRAGPGKTDGFAVASLLLGLAGITVIGAVLGIIFGIMALRRIRHTGQRGRGLAIAGLAFSAIWLLVIGAFFVFGTGTGPAQPPASVGHSSSPTAKPSSSASHGPLSTNVFALRPGQCFQNPPASQTVLGVTYVTVVPCTKPHNAQAFVQFTAKGTSWPGTAALKRQADSGCHARIKGNVQASKIKQSMTLHYLYPLEASWASGHRTITCLIVNSKPNLKTSLLKSHPTGH
jgi:Domain of unknown function (DUF4190)/Septum formation